MKTVLKTAPTSEPVTVAEAKVHLRIDSETLAGNLITYQSILPGSHGVSAGGAYTHLGAGVLVLGKEAIVNLGPGTIGAGGTVDAKIQESDDNITFTDWTGGAFAQVTGASHSLQEMAYTGTKAYIRVAAKVLVAACEFGADVIVNAATIPEEALLTSLITAAREHVEDLTRRALLTQRWYYYLDEFPEGDSIRLPFGNLQNGAGQEPVVSYKDSDGTVTTMTAGTDYLVETNGEGCGAIVLPYGGSWPSAALYPSNPITIEFTAGWETAEDVPEKIKAAILLILGDLWNNREGAVLTNLSYQENRAVKALLSSTVLPWEF
jgi:uncharacterized phiE125 gp8 family phage protein